MQEHKESVLTELQKEPAHSQFMWEEVCTKASVPENYRDTLLAILLDKDFIYEFDGLCIRTYPKVFTEPLGLHEEKNTQIIIGDNNNQFSSIDSTLRLNIDNSKNKTNANSQKSFWQKILHILSNKTVDIVIALLIAFLIFYFGWN